MSDCGMRQTHQNPVPRLQKVVKYRGEKLKMI